VMRESQTGAIAFERTTTTDADGKVTVTTRPIIAQNLTAVETLAYESEGMTAEQAIAANKEGTAARQADFANPMNRTPAARNARAQQQDSVSQAATGGSTVDQVRYNIGDIRNRNLKPTIDITNVPTGSRSRGARGSDGGAVSFIANEENAQKVGFDKGTGLWTPHSSIEGGTDTLAYGHKITPAEQASGTIKIGGKKVKIADGISESQAKQLLDQDVSVARNAVKELVKVPLNKNQRAALTSLIYNVGVKSFRDSNALKALNKGEMDTFRREAFGDKGWNNAKGKPGILAPRRKREEQLFFG